MDRSKRARTTHRTLLHATLSRWSEWGEPRARSDRIFHIPLALPYSPFVRSFDSTVRDEKRSVVDATFTREDFYVGLSTPSLYVFLKNYGVAHSISLAGDRTRLSSSRPGALGSEALNASTLAD